MYIVYVLKSVQFKKSYVGFTNDLERRIQERNSGKGSFTSKYKPWVLIHREEYVNQTDALAREKFLKTKSGRKFLESVVFI